MFAVNHHSFIHSTNSYIIINFTYLCKVVELPVWLKIIKIAIVYSARHCTKYLPNKIIFFFYNSPRRKNYYCQIPQMKHSWKMTSNPGDLSLPWSGWYLTKKMSEKPCINASETCYFPRYIFFFLRKLSFLEESYILGCWNLALGPQKTKFLLYLMPGVAVYLIFNQDKDLNVQ